MNWVHKNDQYYCFINSVFCSKTTFACGLFRIFLQKDLYNYIYFQLAILNIYGTLVNLQGFIKVYL